MWLRDGLPHDLKRARVLVYGYNTNLLESQTFQNVDDIAIAFNESIRSIRIHNRVSWVVRLWRLIGGSFRQGEVMPRPLVFISHSLGGVILKRVRSVDPFLTICDHTNCSQDHSGDEGGRRD
jgi:protein SERAC1